MPKLFNITKRFSDTLDEVRGPDRKKHYLRQAKAWIKPSSSRRMTARILGYGGLSLLAGGLGFALYRNRRQLSKMGSKVKQFVAPTPTTRAVRKLQKIYETGREKLAA